MVNFLLQQGASVNAKTKVQSIKTRIRRSRRQNIGFFLLMVKKKLMSSLLFLQNGYTPLHQAAQQGNTHIINVLLQHGAKPNATTVVRKY